MTDEPLEVSAPFVASDGERRQALVARPRRGEDRAPGLVIVHGFTGTTRSTAKPVMPELLQIMVDHGIGVVRYMPRIIDWPLHRAALVDWNAEIADARGALALLRNQAWLDQRQVYLLGMSLGGYVAPVIAKEDGQVAGIASWGATARPFPPYAVDNLRKQLGFLDKPPAAIERMAVLLDEWHRLLTTTDISGQEMLERAPELRKIGVSPQGRLERSVTFWRQIARFDPAESYRGLECRILAVRGSADCRCHPADQESIMVAAKACGLEVEGLTLEGIDHLFLAADDPIQSARGETSDEPQPAAFGAAIARWIEVGGGR